MLGHAGAVLQSRLHLGALHHLADGDHRVEGLPVSAQLLDHADDAALVAIGALVPGRRVGESERQTGVQVRHLLEPLVEGGGLVLDGVEDLGVWEERDGRPLSLGLADVVDGSPGPAPVELLPVEPPIPSDLHHQPLAEEVDHRRAHAVEPPGDAVAAASELASGVEGGKHGLQGRDAGGLVDLHRDPPTVIGDGHGAVRVDSNGRLVAEARHRLVHGVVHDLVDEVVEPALVCAADVHARTATDGLQALQDLDILGAVPLRGLIGARSIYHGIPPLSRSSRPVFQPPNGGPLGDCRYPAALRSRSAPPGATRTVAWDSLGLEWRRRTHGGR